MRIPVLLTLALVSTAIYSCKKKKTDPPPATLYANYAQLKVGNYWVYEQFEIDIAGNAASKNIFDSCYVEKDTMINAKSYFKVVKPNQNSISQKDILFLRDSLHYIVNSTGKIVFSSLDFTTIFDTNYMLSSPGDTVCQIIKQMADENQTVNTPAGSFVTSNAKEVFFMYPSWVSAGNPRIKHTRYAKDIGIVIETLPFFISNPNYTERRLVRYHIN
ncbi:MAG: hypothetical protein JNM44_11400 [Chitinophagaceae bacterium]|nr:hypothetical protein [Chitinophagaceae bacterium]